MLMKIVGAIVALFLIIWALSDPAHAGVTVHNTIAGLITFLGSVAKG
jgi:hypothetical protein